GGHDRPDVDVEAAAREDEPALLEVDPQQAQAGVRGAGRDDALDVRQDVGQYLLRDVHSHSSTPAAGPGAARLARRGRPGDGARASAGPRGTRRTRPAAAACRTRA